MVNAKYISITALIIVFVCVLWAVVRPMAHNSNGKAKVIMFGRSTMSLWFKHWNWPYPLRIKTTYKPWPIAYKKYSRDNIFYQYFQMSDPVSKKSKHEFGEEMLKSVEDGLNGDSYDAAFFKFCFVDFRVDNNTKALRYERLKNIIWNVYNKTDQRKMKLIIGNALPLPDPNAATLDLQIKYNEWLKEFSKDKKNVFVYDLFNPLVMENGKFNMNLAHAKDDHHPGEKAFKILDKTFFSIMNDFL